MAYGKFKTRASLNPLLAPGNYEIEVYHLSPDNVKLGCRIWKISKLEKETRTFVQALEGFENPEHLIQVLASRALKPVGFSTPQDYPYALDTNELSELIIANYRTYPRHTHIQ